MKQLLIKMMQFLGIAAVENPVHSCDLYIEQGCSHVDGYLCDLPQCSMLSEYKRIPNGEK